MVKNMTEDRIFIKDLLLRGILGVNDWERDKKQDILINMEITTDIRKSGESDYISDTLSYKEVTKAIIELVEVSNFFLIEKLATEIAKLVLREFGADKIKVRVEKPQALRFSDSVGVEIVRTQDDFSD